MSAIKGVDCSELSLAERLQGGWGNSLARVTLALR